MLASLVGALTFHAAAGIQFKTDSLSFQLMIVLNLLSYSRLRCIFCPYPLQA